MIGLLINDKMGNYEKEQKKASYKTIVDYFIGDIVLCNNIIKIDSSVYDNIELSQMYEEDYPEFYQFYLCNISDFDKEKAEAYGLILSYSDKLECDVLCVDHFGTSWDLVLTDCPLFETWEDLEAYNNRGE
jgi:hypothetical protein